MEEQTPNIYEWIKNVINSCTHASHLEPCEYLIAFFERKGAEDYQITALKEALKIQSIEVKKRKPETKSEKELKVEELFSSGKKTATQISTELEIPYFRVLEILNRLMRKDDKKKKK